VVHHAGRDPSTPYHLHHHKNMPAHTRKQPAKTPVPAAEPAPLPDTEPSGLLASVVGDDSAEGRIYRTVFDSIMSQRLAPGTKLPEASLCELFNASRSTVRLALQRLAHDNIVQLRPNRGAIVAVPTLEETRHIFEARRGLEDTLVRLAAERATPEDLSALRQQLKEEHAAMHRFKQPAWVRLASGFHLKVGELGRNPVLQRYLVEMVSRCSLIVALYQPPGNACCEHEQHDAIVDCLERGDADGAARLMDSHLRDLERNIVRSRSSTPAPPPRCSAA
jgi:DNA-binding GntR family transcriptional regulator